MAEIKIILRPQDKEKFKKGMEALALPSGRIPIRVKAAWNENLEAVVKHCDNRADLHSLYRQIL